MSCRHPQMKATALTGNKLEMVVWVVAELNGVGVGGI